VLDFTVNLYDCILIINGGESEVYKNDIVHLNTKYLTIVHPGHAAILFRRTKEAFDTFQRTLYAECVEWDNSSEPEKEDIRNRYCDKYAIFNTYCAMNYLTSFIKDSDLAVKFEKELVYIVLLDLAQSITLNDEYKNFLAEMREEIKITEDTQDDPYEGEKDRIRDLLKAYLALNKRQLDSLRKCSIIKFGIRRRTNGEFLALLKLHPSWDRLRYIEYSAGEDSRELDRQLWSDISSLDNVLEKDSDITHIESRMYKWTYADMLVHGQKILPDDVATDKLDLANLPKSKEFIVTLENSFDPIRDYDCISVYTKFRFGIDKEYSSPSK
jgi:hypothetical protein